MNDEESDFLTWPEFTGALACEQANNGARMYGVQVQRIVVEPS